MKNFEPTFEQWRKIDEAIDDMILFQVEPKKLLNTVIDSTPTTSFFAESNDFDGDRKLELEFRIFKAKAEVEIRDEKKMILVRVEMECTRANLYDCDKGDIELPKEFCDKITVNLKPIIYGSK